MRNSLILGTLVVFLAMAAIPSAMAANTFYLVPQDSTGNPGGSTTVDLMLAADTDFKGYQLTINFDDSIVDIPDTGITFIWGIGSATNYGTYITIAAMDTSASPNGTYTLATLTLNGQSTTGISGLNFTGNLLSDPNGDPLANICINGTYTNQAPSEPDLVVTKIDPKNTIFADATNVFTVYVKNQGTADVTGSFDVSWQITDDASTVLASGTETITGLAINEEKRFNFNWKPTVVQNTTVSATADSGSAVTESDETNNTLSVTYIANDESGTGILPLSKWGYGGDEPLTNVLSGEVVGDLIYTFGDSAYLGGYNNPWSTYTVNFSLGTDVNQISGSPEGVGSSGTVKEARLYMYYNWYRYPDAGRPADPEAVMTMEFDGSPISTVAKYEDSKGFGGTYAGYKYGTFVYNVTPYVTGDGTYQAVLSNAGEGDAHGTSIYGMALLVIYEDGTKSLKEYHIAEGHDLLRQYYYSSSAGRYYYHVLPEDATSTFSMPAATGGYTELFTVTAAAASGGDMSRLYFNTGQWSSPWTYLSGIRMGTDTTDVTLLKANPNTVEFQDRGDGYSATNAILISYKGKQIDLGPEQDTEVGRHIMVPITANDLEQFYGTVEMNLNYDPAKFDFVAVHSSPDSIVTAYQDDYPSTGKLDISAWNQHGVKGDVVLATVELEVIGGEGSDSELNLTVDVFEDVYGNAIDAYPVPTTIHIKDPAGVLAVTSAISDPVSDLGDNNSGILNDNGRPRHAGDNETVISADVTDSGLGIKSVTVDLSAIGGAANTLMTETSPGHYEVTTKATSGISATHTFVITATDNGGNTATGTTNSLTVYRRGDVTQNNKVDMGDALYIARYTVGLESPVMDHFNFVGDVQPASDGDHTVNMGDALYIARYTVGLEPAP